MCLEPRQRPPPVEKIPPESNPARLPADFLGFLRLILCDTAHRMEYQTRSARTLIIRRLFFCFPGTVGLTGSLKITELHRCTQTLAECSVMLGIALQLRERLVDGMQDPDKSNAALSAKLLTDSLRD